MVLRPDQNRQKARNAAITREGMRSIVASRRFAHACPPLFPRPGIRARDAVRIVR